MNIFTCTARRSDRVFHCSSLLNFHCSRTGSILPLAIECICWVKLDIRTGYFAIGRWYPRKWWPIFNVRSNNYPIIKQELKRTMRFAVCLDSEATSASGTIQPLDRYTGKPRVCPFTINAPITANQIIFSCSVVNLTSDSSFKVYLWLLERIFQ